MELKEIVAKNICDLRKIYKMTQAELAEKLSYSDKAVSKWERAEAIPDVETIKKMSEIFGVSVDCLLTENTDIKKNIKTRRLSVSQKFLISIISAVLVWVVATAAFAILNWSGVRASLAAVSFIYAIPITFIVLIVFNGMWGKTWATLLLVSGLVWTVALSVYLTPVFFGMQSSIIWLIFICAIPVQIGFILFYGLQVLNDSQKKKAAASSHGISDVKKKLAAEVEVRVSENEPVEAQIQAEKSEHADTEN